MDGHVHLKFVAQTLSLVGFWPRKFKNRYNQTLYSILSKLTLIVFIVLIATEFIELYHIVGNSLEDVSVLMGLNIFHMLGLAKTWVAAGNLVDRLRKKIQITERTILKSNDENVKRIYMECVNLNYACNKFMMRISIFCYIMYITIPYCSDLISSPGYLYTIFNGTVIYRPRPLPLASWFPFDRYKYYWISYFWHVIALTFVPLYIIGCNLLFYALIIFSIGQLKILQHHLIELRKGISRKEDDVIEENLRKCVIHHKRVILYVEELSTAMKTFLLMDFTGCGLQIAIIGFQAAITDASLQMMKSVVYLATMLTQLFFLYWFANETLLESINVSKAVWESEWYDCNQNTKRALLVVIIRAQKPLTLSIGPFYHMSTETLMTILRFAYSYAMLMRRLYRK